MQQRLEITIFYEIDQRTLVCCGVTVCRADKESQIVKDHVEVFIHLWVDDDLFIGNRFEKMKGFQLQIKPVAVRFNGRKKQVDPIAVKSPFRKRGHRDYIKWIDQVENILIFFNISVFRRSRCGKGIGIHCLKKAAVCGICREIIYHCGRTAVSGGPETDLSHKLMFPDIGLQTLRYFIRRIIEPFYTVIVVDRQVPCPFALIVITGNGDRDQYFVSGIFVRDRGADRIDRRSDVKVDRPRLDETGLSEEIQNIMIFLGKITVFVSETGDSQGKGGLHQLVVVNVIRLQQPFIGIVNGDYLIFAFGPAVLNGY